jgi:hypothetical protein
MILSVLSAISPFPLLIVLIVEQLVGDGKPRLTSPGPAQASIDHLSGLVVMHRVRLDRAPSATQHEAGEPPDREPIRDCSTAQHFGGGDQAVPGGLAVLAKPGSDVHRIPEIRDLPLCDAALADDDGTGMNAGAEPRHSAEFLGIGQGKINHFFFDGEEAA